MKVDGIQQAALLSTQLNRQSPQALQNFKSSDIKEKSQDNSAKSDNVSLNITVSRQTLDTLERIGSVTDFLNSTAKSIRETDSALKLSADIIAKMKEDLAKIVKNFPPYPIDSSERRDILRSYLALRREIDSMTVPTPIAPVYERVDHLWESIFNDNSGIIRTPDLTESSGDLTVKAALSSVTSTGEAISQTRTALGSSSS